ncbi:sensor histidine kinase [Actinophytocola sp.]|uniref:sensor histidine kinase n=1 Tax=Actinophytocola sp. TaxID=1872138 RepID=UPI00389A08F9
MPARQHVPNQQRRRSTTDVLPYLLFAMAVTAGATLWTIFQVPRSDRPLVAVTMGTLAIALWIALAVAVRRALHAGRTTARLRTLDAGLRRLVDEVLPDAARRVRDGASADTVLADLKAADVPREVLAAVVREIALSERQRSAAMAACANAAGRVQAMATSMLADLREMEGRHAEDVLGDLLRLDHSTAQTGRLADSIAVLTGARSGRRWTRPIVVESILRGALGRIQAYQRVQVHSGSTAAVVGYAAEDVMHALAELMDNATRFSAPSEEVHVYVEELHTGLVITIEDGGLGMKPQALARAEAAVSTAEPLDLAKVPGTRLGLVVVGSLARKHKLQVYFRPSSRGGTGVVVRIPNQLVVHPREEEPTVSMPKPVESVASAGGEATTTSATATAVLEPAPPDEDVADVTELPKRPRGQTLAKAVRATEANRETPKRTEKRTDIGARFSAFQQGRRSTEPAQDAAETGREDDSE